MDTTLFQDKHAAYQQLIARVRASYPAYHEATEYEKGQLVWCNDCQQEINLWSYWQDSLDAKMILVGQDWGCPFDKVFLPTMAQIQNANSGKAYSYISDTPSQTDQNLIKLFSKALGKDITIPCDDLKSAGGNSVPVRVRLAAPNQYNPNQIFPVGDGFGLFVFFGKFEETYFRNGVIKRPESKPRDPRKKKQL